MYDEVKLLKHELARILESVQRGRSAPSGWVDVGRLEGWLERLPVMLCELLERHDRGRGWRPARYGSARWLAQVESGGRYIRLLAQLRRQLRAAWNVVIDLS